MIHSFESKCDITCRVSVSTFLAKCGSVNAMPCVNHCHSISVPSLPVPPLTISTTDSQTLCPEERAERGGGERAGGERVF